MHHLTVAAFFTSFGVLSLPGYQVMWKFQSSKKFQGRGPGGQVLGFLTKKKQTQTCLHRLAPGQQACFYLSSPCLPFNPFTVRNTTTPPTSNAKTCTVLPLDAPCPFLVGERTLWSPPPNWSVLSPFKLPSGPILSPARPTNCNRYKSVNHRRPTNNPWHIQPHRPTSKPANTFQIYRCIWNIPTRPT